VDPKIETRKLGTIFIKREDPKLSGKNRVFDGEFKQNVVQRILGGENVSALQEEFRIKRSVLYRWRDTYRKEGAAGLQRPIGRPSGLPDRPRVVASPTRPEEVALSHIAELERKIGQQALDIDFLRRAFKRVKESRRKHAKAGGTASTERSEA
jgi:transposase